MNTNPVRRLTRVTLVLEELLCQSEQTPEMDPWIDWVSDSLDYETRLLEATLNRLESVSWHSAGDLAESMFSTYETVLEACDHLRLGLDEADPTRCLCALELLNYSANRLDELELDIFERRDEFALVA